jgi:hypothetical protein
VENESYGVRWACPCAFLKKLNAGFRIFEGVLRYFRIWTTTLVCSFQIPYSHCGFHSPCHSPGCQGDPLWGIFLGRSASNFPLIRHGPKRNKIPAVILPRWALNGMKRALPCFRNTKMVGGICWSKPGLIASEGRNKSCRGESLSLIAEPHGS